MPHKHTRRGEDKSTVDLPPTVIARPLPVSKSAKSNGVFTNEDRDNRKPNKKKRKVEDDTPRAFARIMAFRDGKKLPKGLDDGKRSVQKKKQRGGENPAPENPITDNGQSQKEAPIIRPGESMSEFSARVDAALPFSGLRTKGGKDPLGLAPVRTKKEKKMHKMYAEWREQDRKIKEKREEELEEAEEAEDEDAGLGVKWKIDMEAAEQRKKKKGKSKKKKVIGEVDDGDDDPWAALAKARAEAPRKLHDVVHAPPQFTKLPKEKIKVRGAQVDVENIPKASGSLRRREELSEVRRSVVEGYREMMKRNQASS